MDSEALDAQERPRPPVPRLDLVGDEQRTVLRGDPVHRRQERRRGDDEATFAELRLHDHRGDLVLREDLPGRLLEGLHRGPLEAGVRQPVHPGSERPEALKHQGFRAVTIQSARTIILAQMGSEGP